MLDPKHIFISLSLYLQEGLSTGMVFNNLDLSTMCSPTDPQELLSMFTEMGALRAASLGGLQNDLEPPAFQCSPSLGKLKRALCGAMSRYPPCTNDEKGGVGEPVVMSGSGTSIYCLTDGTPPRKEEQMAVADLLANNPGLQYFKCSFLNKPNSVEAWYDFSS